MSHLCAWFLATKIQYFYKKVLSRNCKLNFVGTLKTNPTGSSYLAAPSAFVFIVHVCVHDQDRGMVRHTNNILVDTLQLTQNEILEILPVSMHGSLVVISIVLEFLRHVHCSFSPLAHRHFC